MRIRKLVLNGFRSYDRVELEPSEGLNLLYGANAAGPRRRDPLVR